MEKKGSIYPLIWSGKKAYLYAIFLLTLSPGVDPEILQGVEELKAGAQV